MFWENFLGLCADKGKSPTAVVLDLGLSRSSVTNWKRGVIPNNVAAKKIANYFGVTVASLLGNDDKISIHGNTISGTNHVFGNINTPISGNAEILSAQEKELLNCFRALSEVEKAKALIYISELSEKEDKQ